MLVELRQAGSERLLDRLELEDAPHPGRWFEHGHESYLVLQRRHRYALRSGRYQLASVVLLVKQQRQPVDAQRYRHGWVIGDPSCRFNALNPLLRCAVLPDGPCESCLHYQSRA
jgi:hypothetical protein